MPQSFWSSLAWFLSTYFGPLAATVIVNLLQIFQFFAPILFLGLPWHRILVRLGFQGALRWLLWSIVVLSNFVGGIILYPISTQNPELAESLMLIFVFIGYMGFLITAYGGDRNTRSRR